MFTHHSPFLIGLSLLELMYSRIIKPLIAPILSYGRACVLVVRVLGFNQEIFNVAGSLFLYLEIILVQGFMKQLTIARQRLALHDLIIELIKRLGFLTSWLFSKKEATLQTIRKPKRQGCGFGIHF